MLRPWDRKLVLHRAPGVPVYMQIVAALIEDIRRGRLAPGAILPGSRELAADLLVNRKTVVQAYDELIAQGWLSSARTRGTFVSAHLPSAPEPAASLAAESAIPRRPNYKLRPRQFPSTHDSPPPNTIVFDDGLPDARLMPAALLARAQRRRLLDAARRNRLGYGDPRGTEALRQAVCTMLRLDRGIPCTIENICIVRGTQMGIYLAARILVSPGDTVAVEALSYPPARDAFREAGATIEPVPLDSGGIRLDALESLCRRRRVRAVYVTPHHQFPTTVLLRPERRLHLLALSEQFGFAIVEDDYDHEFHFAHAPMLPLASADRWGKTIYIGSLSKLLSPSLRVGYMVAPADIIAEAAGRIMLIDRQGDPTTEAAVAELMESGVIKSHTRKTLRIYAERRQVFADLLRHHFGDRLQFSLPDGGLALWLHPDTVIAPGNGVWFRPGAAYTAANTEEPGLRLGFGSLDATELERGVHRLAARLKA